MNRNTKLISAQRGLTRICGSPGAACRAGLLLFLGLLLSACAGDDDQPKTGAEAETAGPPQLYVENLYPFTRLQVEYRDGQELDDPIGGIFDESTLTLTPGCHSITVSDGPGLTLDLLRLSCGTLRFTAREGEQYHLESAGAATVSLTRGDGGSVVVRGKMRRIGPFDDCAPDPALMCRASSQ